MDFSIIEQNNCLYVTIHPGDAADPKSLFTMIDKMSHAIREMYLRKKLPVTFDLLAVSQIDTYLISLLVQIFRLTAPGKNILLASSRQVLDVIVMIGIDKMYTVYHSKKEWRGNSRHHEQAHS